MIESFLSTLVEGFSGALAPEVAYRRLTLLGAAVLLGFIFFVGHLIDDYVRGDFQVSDIPGCLGISLGVSALGYAVFWLMIFRRRQR